MFFQSWDSHNVVEVIELGWPLEYWTLTSSSLVSSRFQKYIFPIGSCTKLGGIGSGNTLTFHFFINDSIEPKFLLYDLQGLPQVIPVLDYSCHNYWIWSFNMSNGGKFLTHGIPAGYLGEQHLKIWADLDH